MLQPTHEIVLPCLCVFCEELIKMSIQQLPTFVLQHLESIKKELKDVANELSDSPLQGRLLKLSDRVETLVVETFSKGQTSNTTQKHEDLQGKDEPTSAGTEEKVDSSEREQKPPDVFLTSPGNSNTKFGEPSKIKNVKRNRHERGASRHQRVWSRNSIADFEDPSAPNIMKELKHIAPDTTSSEDEEGNEENRDSELKDEEEVGNPVKVSATVGSEFHHEENISLKGVKDVTSEEPVVFLASDRVGISKEHLRNMSFGGVMQVVGTTNDEEMKVAKQIQEIIGGSKEDLGDLARKLLQVKSSKIDLVKSTAEEITRLRDIIKTLASQLRELRVEYNKLLNPSFGGQIFGAVASLFYTRSQ